MKITSFSGRRAVDVREYYEKDEEWLPGKKVCLRCVVCFWVLFFFFWREYPLWDFGAGLHGLIRLL